MGKNQSASNLTNIIQYNNGNITFVSGSTTLMQISSSGAITTTGVISGSNALSASYAAIASFVALAQTASFVQTAQTASFVANAQSASNAVSAITASSADSFLVRNTLTAQTIVVQVITSSQDFVTGSTKFGSLSINTHQFTGSMSITGGLNLNAGILGVGLTPSSWASGTQAIETIAGGLYPFNISNLHILQNAYYNGTNWAYKNSLGASRYQLNIGNHYWYTAPTGVADNPITWSQAMTLNSSNQLGIGTTSPSSTLHVSSSAAASTIFRVDTANGNGTLFVSSSGFVGVGTTNPTVKLDVGYDSNNRSIVRLFSNAANRMAAIRFDGNNAESGYIGYEGGSEIVSGGQQGDLVIRNVLSGKDIILDTNAGNVGIGTTNPVYGLEISTANDVKFKSTDAYMTLFLDNTGANGGGGIYFQQSGSIGGGIGSSGWWIGDTSNDLFLVSTSGKNIRFCTNDNSTPKMFVSASGNVGIGTTAPATHLHVRGAGTSAGVVARFSGTGPSGSIELGHSVNGGYIGYANLGASDQANVFYVTTGAGTIGSGFVMNNAGNVGIGSTNPATYKLEVNGGIYASSGFFGNATTATRPAATATRSGNFSSGTVNGTENVDISSYYLPYFGPVWFYFNVGYNGNGAISANWLGLADAHYFNNGTANIIWTDDGATGGASLPTISVSVQGSTYTTRYLRVTFTATGGYAPNNWNWTFGAWNAFP